jgi:hypothetical protein
MRALALLILFIPACGGGVSASPSCKVDTYPDDCVSANDGCDAVTKKCKLAPKCSSDQDCNGYTCTISSVCRLNCRGQAGPDDSLCDIGYLCDAMTLECQKATNCDPGAGTSGCNGLLCDPVTMLCVVGASCITDDDCGTYYCDPVAGCYTSCMDFTQCGSNYTCDFISGRCS